MKKYVFSSISILLIFICSNIFANSIDITVENNITHVKLTASDNQTFDINYSYPIFKLVFNEGIANIERPSIPPNSIIKNIDFTYGKDIKKIKSINFYLKNKIQYLISKKDNKLKLLFIKKTEQDKNSLEDIKFTKDEQNNLYIKLKFSKDVNYSLQTEKNNSLGVLFSNTMIPKSLIRIYSLEKFKSCVRYVYLDKGQNGGIMHITFFKRMPLKIKKQGDYLVLSFPPMPSGDVATTKVTKKDVSHNATQNTNLEEGTLLPGMKKHYTGTPISIDLQDAEVKHVLRLLAEVGGYNIIIDEKVGGTITLKLKKVPWDQVLDLVLLQKNLGMVKQGNIIRIAPISKIQEEQRLAKETIEQKKQLEPLITRYIRVNYTTAAEVSPKLEKFLTKRGSISYDSRTNQLIISDTKEAVDRIQRVLKKLDQPEKQVLIEARVVYATESFQRGLGITWGGNFQTGATYGGPKFDIGINNFAINLPTNAATTFGLGGHIAKITGSTLFNLDAQLALGESRGEVNTISSPRIITLNNQQAEVIQGTKIATKTESQSGGTTTQYQDAVLKLSVLPQITPDNNLILDIKISDDSPVPGGEDIETKSASTKLMVKDGETIVIGGVQQITESREQQRVPILSKIPIIGNVFKNRFKNQEKRELLIFIRPKIL